MKILYLTPYLPSPPYSGGSRRMHGLISGVAESHEVSVLSLVGPGDNSAQVRATAEYCQEVVTVESERSSLSTSAKRSLQLRSMLGLSSYERLVSYDPAMQTALDEMVSRTRYDVINVEFSQMAYYRFPNTSQLVLDEHNIEYDILHRTLRVETDLRRKLYNYANYLKLRREEHAVWRKFDGCCLTSQRDEDILRREFPSLPTRVIPNGVDTQFFRSTGAPLEPMTLLFFGTMNYHPNTDGLHFFVTEIMPILKRQYPQLRLLVVGGASPDLITRFSSEDVTLTGSVEDVHPYIERAEILICPLRIGGGTRLKILEAMSMGKPIVSTSLGAEGIGVTNGQDILLADSPNDFAAQVGRLLDGAALRRELGSAARRLVEEQYDWRVAVRWLEAFYDHLLWSGRERTTPIPATAGISEGA